MPKINITRATDAEIAPIMELERACFAVPWSEGAVLREIYGGDTLFLLAKLDAEIAGFSIARLFADDAELFQIAAAQELRRRGIAKTLLEHTIDELRTRGLTALFLEVRESNASAIALYDAFGFMRAGLRKGYYERPVEDAIVMRKEL